MEVAQLYQLKLSAILLLSGSILFWAGAFTPPWKWWYPISNEEYLSMIADHRLVWLWIAGAFAIGVILTTLGFIQLASILNQKGEKLWSLLGQYAFFFGAILWVISIAFRATATVSASGEVMSTGLVPNWFEPMHSWAGSLWAIYMVLAYFSIAAFGKSILAVGFEPTWIGKTFLYFGLVAIIGFLVQIPVFVPPLMVHLVPGIFGVVILLKYGLI